MAVKCKVMLHSVGDLVSEDGDDDGKLAEDVQDYITANKGTLANTTSLNVTSTMIEGGSHVMTLITLDDTA